MLWAETSLSRIATIARPVGDRQQIRRNPKHEYQHDQ